MRDTEDQPKQEKIAVGGFDCSIRCAPLYNGLDFRALVYELFGQGFGFYMGHDGSSPTSHSS